MLHFGVIGYPVAHSLSPQVHGAAFQAAGIDAISERIEVQPEALADFMKNFHEKYSGVNVTIPHKETIMAFLDEIDDEAKAIGAVNLVVSEALRPKGQGFRTTSSGLVGPERVVPKEGGQVRTLEEGEASSWGKRSFPQNKNGKLIGYNVDLYGAMMALYEASFPTQFSLLSTGDLPPFLHRLSVTVLGAGGASRAVCFGILKYGGDLTILNRHKERAKNIADDFAKYFPKSKIRVGDLTDFGKQQMDILINTTPCGMTPNEEETPIPHAGQKFKSLSKKPLIMDIVYRPRRTKFIQEAEQAGLKTIGGERMFLHQAARGFELWTGQKAPFEEMEKALYKVLSW